MRASSTVQPGVHARLAVVRVGLEDVESPPPCRMLPHVLTKPGSSRAQAAALHRLAPVLGESLCRGDQALWHLGSIGFGSPHEDDKP
eukprot:CAMPEP_0171144916 /NCGR_PEP_ID=MMETSP0766_2-20121228/146755_1 /TAXON_ID=439317 /ORGANISM="Gambierdiscus australes, Strain CAWD 149" /LENGTH=86 /DNA_ID=CAMNT_0011608797 /DNA_START=21 /DNA_END=277 /DNA_ORIENTATION=+